MHVMSVRIKLICGGKPKTKHSIQPYACQYSQFKQFHFNDYCRYGNAKIKMKFATYRSAGFNYRSRRPTFKPQKMEEATTSAQGIISQPQIAESIPEQKPPVCFLNLPLPDCNHSQ